MTNVIRSFINKNGELRIYDGANTPHYLKILFTGADFTGPLGLPKVEEILILDRNNTSVNMHYVEGSDARILEPLAISFSGRCYDYNPCKFLVDWLLLGIANGVTLTTTKGGSRRDGTNTNPVFQDATKKCYDIYLKYSTSGVGSGTSYDDVVIAYKETFFEPSEQSINESEDSLTINMSGMCYGSIEYNSGDFPTTGNDLASAYTY